MKKIRMTKSVYDNQRSGTTGNYVNEASKQLTAFFFGNGHPFRERMRLKVLDEDIDKRCIRLIPVKMEECTREGCREPVVYIHQLMLEIIMKDSENEHGYADDGYNALLSDYLNGQLSLYMNGQCFNVPTRDADETDRFLRYLSQFVPVIGDFFQTTGE